MIHRAEAIAVSKEMLNSDLSISSLGLLLRILHTKLVDPDTLEEDYPKEVRELRTKGWLVKSYLTNANEKIVDVVWEVRDKR